MAGGTHGNVRLSRRHWWRLRCPPRLAGTGEACPAQQPRRDPHAPATMRVAHARGGKHQVRSGKVGQRFRCEAENSPPVLLDVLQRDGEERRGPGTRLTGAPAGISLRSPR